MEEPRLKTKIRIDAHLMRVRAAGAFAAIARKGDADAGAVAVKVYLGARRARLFMQSRDIDGAPVWRAPLGGEEDETAIDAFLAREVSIDPDMWIIEIEDREGRAFLDAPVADGD